MKLLLPLVRTITQADCRHVRWNEQSRPPERRAGAAVIKIINYARVSGPQNGHEIYAATISQIPRRTVDVNHYIVVCNPLHPNITFAITFAVESTQNVAYVHQHRRDQRTIRQK